MSITTVHHNLPAVVSLSIIKSLIGSLNATAIAYTRGHLKFNGKNNPTGESAGYKRPVHEDEKCIDDVNDEIAAVNEAIERNQAATGMGFAPQMPTGELIKHLMDIRAYFIQRHEIMKTRRDDVPLTIAETVKFQMDRQPENKDAFIDALVAALGDDVSITADMLKAANLKMVVTDAADLKANAGKIVDYLGQYGDGEDSNLDDEYIEAQFDALPAHVQYKLMSAAIRAHDKQSEASLIKLLRGKLDAAGDIKMLKGNRDDLIKWLVQFSKTHRNDLDAYVDRGGMLMELEDRTVVTSNEPVTNTKAPSKSEVAAAIKADKAKMQRAPAPTAQ